LYVAFEWGISQALHDDRRKDGPTLPSELMLDSDDEEVIKEMTRWSHKSHEASIASRCAQQLKVVHLVASAMLLTLRLPPLERYR
jgi:hypothetical protein